MPYGGRCRRNRKEQLSAPGFWLAVSCRRITSSLRSAVSTDLQGRACGSVRQLDGAMARSPWFHQLRRRQRLRRRVLDLTMTICPRDRTSFWRPVHR